MLDRLRGGSRLTIVPFAIAIASLGSCTSEHAAPPTPGEPSTDGGGGAPPEDAGAPLADGAPAEDAPLPSMSYTNPVFAEDFPDPFVLRDGDRYYAFATNSAGSNVRVVESSDLARWTELPDALPELPAWAKSNASLTWAPSVLRRGATFVLFYTARDVASGFQCIGRATAATPAGPYVDESSGPFICQVSGAEDLCGSIDPSPFVDENGDAYLLWKSDENATACKGDARLWTHRLGIDGLSLLGSPTELLRRDRGWEAPLIEGPSMVKLQDRYYLFYSANWWESSSYGIGYATCATAVGPCAKQTLDGPFVKSAGETLGPGGQELFTDASGKLWMAYHAWSSPIVGYHNGGARSLRIDPIELSADGVPSLAGPTSTARPL